ncbi:conserved hypothetical protein [Histoplasma capsulatum H143]|uniref:Autophagy-related protein 16 domain-containing protein n=1 Tax=Ajellomyces capsulatus (strain H143) TaxID=544712 RepID=C6HKW3_AJECH|nr:conserved hypothetical protein [Histoplasma capsulatum H143]
MSNWQEEYLLALGVRDAREQANAAIYDAYTRLADRTSKAHSSSSPTRPAGSPADERELRSCSENECECAQHEQLSAEKALLLTRVKDRDEELRGKAKLLDNVQTELVSLNLQFNMAEDRAKRLEAENKELVDRWMARMGQEADAMNKASKFS